ncbi:MAG TPA: hypothetical protein VKA21_11895 [Candidatus Binatia bacterium]|nr:hypothetical protein [Candidatus Binatia bacterium]
MTRSLAGLLALVVVTSAGAMPTAGERCAAAKILAAVKKAKAKGACHAKAVLGGDDLAACVGKAEGKFSAAWAKILAHGGCASTGDEADIESKVDAFVADLVAELPPGPTTSTTSTPTTTCPPSTAFYCGFNSCAPGLALCPAGMTCIPDGSFCTCDGTPPPCGNLNAPMCQWGECPAGMTCGFDDTQGICPPPCVCR